MKPKSEYKPLTKKDLANLYQVNVKTFCKWLQPFAKEVGKPAGHFYLPKQIIIIYEKIGEP